MRLERRCGVVSVRRTSIVSGKEGVMSLDLNVEEYEKGLALWESGTLIQEAFPTLSADEREFLMTGIGPTEWDELFPDI
jgi:hypothetical protein